MTEPKPQVLTQCCSPKLKVSRAARWTHQEMLAYQLTQVCRGRENHAALFSLGAERDPASGDILLHWTDEFTGQAGLLGSLQRKETPIVRTLFEQLRAWRERCEQYGVPKAMAAGSGR